MSVRWGLSATILAPVEHTLRFAAYHLELGAHRLYLYLDDGNEDAYNALKPHPKIRVQRCNTAHWKKLIGKRPDRHQVRQTLNATHAYNRRAEVDWLIHMDVDEFIVSNRALPDLLAALPRDTEAARLRPMELLGGSTDMFKAFIPAGSARQQLVEAIYPRFGRYLRAGFISHVAGKVLLRTGLDGVGVQIHDGFRGDDRIPATELIEAEIAHCHATSWQAWRAAFDYRLGQGSYRPSIKPLQPPEKGGLSIHEMLRTIAESEGDAGLRAFYDEVIGDSDDLRDRLAKHGLLRQHQLDLEAPLQRHFPDHAV